jgi:uncharacterized protein with GYD domain
MVQACILARVKGGKGPAVLSGLKKLPEIKSAFFVLGRYDVVAFAEAADAAALRSLIERANSIDGIKSTETLLEV